MFYDFLKHFFSIILILFGFAVVNGQDYISNIRTFDIQDGLTHSDIQTLFQDSQGLLWVGTRHGLNYYDSDEFRTIKKGEKGLTHEKVTGIQEDADGFLWLLVTDAWDDLPTNINFIDVRTHEVFSFEERFGEVTEVSFKHITHIKTNERNDIFLKTKDQKIYYWSSAEGFRTIQLPSNSASLDFITKDNVIGLRTQHAELLTVNLDGTILDKIPFPAADLVFITTDRQGRRIYHSPSKGFFEYKNNQFYPFPFKDSQLLEAFSNFTHTYTFAYRKQDDTYWFAMGKAGLKIFHPQKGMIYHFSQILKTEDIYIDHRGLGWLIDLGLKQVNVEQNKFQRLLHQPLIKQELSPIHHSIRQIIKSQNTLHITTARGIFTIDSLHNVSHFGVSISGCSMIEPRTDTFLYSDNVFLQQYEKGQLTKSYPTHQFGAIWSMYQDKYGKIWLGGNNKFGYLPNLDTVPAFFENYAAFPELKNAIVYQFFPKDESEVLLISNKGIFILNIDQSKIINRFWTGGKGNYFLPKNSIHHLHQDQKDKAIFWLATTEGLVKWNTRTHEFEIFDTQTGLPNNVIYAVYEDDFNHLWMSSNFGIIRMNKTTGQVDNYLEKEGITHFEFNRVSHFQDKIGKIYFGGLNGITAFHPKDFLKESNALSLPMRVVQFQQFNGEREQLEDKTLELRQSQKITLQPNDQFCILDFVLLDFKSQNGGLYAYQIEGLNEDWSYIRDNTLHLRHLPYGNYVLKIKGQTHRGTFSTEELTVPLQVIRPFYKSGWFILFCILLVGGAAFTAYQLRTIQLRRRNIYLESLVQQRTVQLRKDKLIIEKQAQKLKKADELKSRFFVNVSHELRTPLTLILSPVQILLKNATGFTTQNHRLHTTIQQNALKLLNLIEEVLELSKLEADKVKLEEDEVLIHPYFVRLFRSFQPLAQSKNIDYTIDFQPNKSLSVFLDKKKFEHIVGNLLSNAIKYTPTNGKVDLIIQQIDNQLITIIKDNGVGIHENDLPYIFDRYYQTQQAEKWTRGTGIGLALAHELTKLFKGSLTVESDYGKGSVFTFAMPVRLAFSEKKSCDKVIELPIQNGVHDFEELPFDKNRPTILLVEDNLEMSQFLISVLSEKYNLVTAQNGIEALEKIPTANCHLVLSDIMMPKMDGFELLKNLKKHPQWINIPVILLSAKTEWKDKLKALTIGIDDYVTKPFMVEELLARIQNSLNNAKARQLFAQNNKAKNTDSSPSNLLPKDLHWLESVNEILKRELTNGQFGIVNLAYDLALSERQFHRKIKTITGLTPNSYVREFKLNQARDLLEAGKVNTISEATFAVGFETPYYFSTLFEKRFGKKPQAYFQQRV